MENGFDYKSVINSHTGKSYEIYMVEKLCNMYRILLRDGYDIRDEKMGGKKDLVNDLEMAYLEHSIGVVLRQMNGSYPTGKFIKGVYKEINNIRIFYENQPEYNVTIIYPGYDKDGNYILLEREMVVRTYYKPYYDDSVYVTNEFKETCYMVKWSEEKITKVIKIK